MNEFIRRMLNIENGGAKEEPLVNVERATFTGSLPEIAKMAPKGIVAEVIERKLIKATCELYGTNAERDKFMERMKAAVKKPDGTEDIVIVTKMLAIMIEMDMRGEKVDIEKAAEEALE